MNIKRAGESSFEDVVEGANSRVSEIAYSLRDLVASVMPGVTEVAWPKQRIVGYGVGPKKMSEHFCYIGLHERHVNLGFLYGAELEDPDRLLQGTGKVLRHIRFAGHAETKHQRVRNLVVRASQHLPKLAGHEG